MKVLITGADGMLGRTLQHELQGVEVIPTNHKTADITDAAAFDRCLALHKPDVVIHCAAMTAVDKCETEIDQAYRINAVGTENVASACYRHGAKLIAISTDYVFDGQGTEPWKPDCKDYKPLNVYGQTKYEGELAVQNTLEKYFIVRISWVFGVNGKNFIKTMLNLGKTHDHLTVVNDQFGSPTYTYDLARLLVDMVLTDKYGIYHATNEGICNWYEFACEIFRQAGMKVDVAPVPASEYPTKAKRPENSRMSKAKLTENGFVRLPSWQDALERYLKEIL